MKNVTKIIIAAGLMCMLSVAAAQAREIVDMAGRRVEIPDNPARVYSPAPYGVIIIYAFNPAILCSTMKLYNEAESVWLDERARNLPVIGSLSGDGATANLEKLLAAKPDLALNFVMGHKDDYDPVNSRAEQVFNRLGIPYVTVFAKDLRDYPAVCEFLGEVFNAPTRGRAMADYVRGALADAARLVAEVPPAKRPRVYYAVGLDGLTTANQNSYHAVLLKIAGNVNVHVNEQLPDNTGMYEKLSLEHVYSYDPDIVFVYDKLFYDQVYANPNWQRIKAVRDRKVYYYPRGPFIWCDRPPSIMGAIGLKWTLTKLYPEHYDIDIVAEAQKFYQDFLWADISYAEMEQIVNP